MRSAIASAWSPAVGCREPPLGQALRRELVEGDDHRRLVEADDSRQLRLGVLALHRGLEDVMRTGGDAEALERRRQLGLEHVAGLRQQPAKVRGKRLLARGRLPHGADANR
jgi:hypothetical protein